MSDTCQIRQSAIHNRVAETGNELYRVCTSGLHIFEKRRSHLKILGARVTT